jgi:hypothetical protein
MNIFVNNLQQKIGFAYAQSTKKCFKIEILSKIERKEEKKLQYIAKEHTSFRFWSPPPKKKIKIYHACVPLKGQ